MPSKIFDSLASFDEETEPLPDAASLGKRLCTDDGTVLLVDEVRRGGMGIVYLCRFDSTDPTKRGSVALKTFDDRFFFDVTTADTFERELALWMLVGDVPFVLPLIGTFTIDHKPHLVMVAANGDGRGNLSVRDALQGSPNGLPADDVLTIALCVAIAMAKATERVPSLVHGDLKPDNILYVGGRPFLSDFGLSGLGDRAGRRGTPPYMAPELWATDGRQAVATDVYAYGALLAELITGKLPIVANADDPAAWSRAHLKQAPQVGLATGRDDQDVTANLRSLALRCLAKSPAERPPDFSTLMREALALVKAHDPVLALMIVADAARNVETARAEQAERALSRLKELVNNHQFAAATQLAATLPESDLQGELLMMVGTVWSLANDDEKALSYFERFLAEHPAPESRFRCLNEVGLSLKRLGRLAEAKKLYEELLVEALGDDELDMMARTNYAGVLHEDGEFDAAILELKRTVRKHADRPQPLALLAMALGDAGKPAEAIAMIDRAIGLMPRNGNYQVMRADQLLELGRVSDAFESLRRAYSLGFHSRRWLVLTVLTQLALGLDADAAQLLASARAQLPEGEADAVLREANDRLRVLASRSGSSEEPADDLPSDHDGENPEAVTPGDEPPTIAGPTPVERDEEAEAEAHRSAIRNGQTAHVQVRMSSVDGSVAIDFYLRTNAANYVAQFRNAYAQLRARTLPGDYAERQVRYRFARCEHCSFDVLTARDEGERFLCQACGERGPVHSTHSEVLASLASECETAIGRKEREPSGTTLLVAFWAATEDSERAISARMRSEGYQQADAEALAFVTFQHQAGQRGVQVNEAPGQIWSKADCEGGTTGETPRSLDRLLRQLRREVGPFQSMSMEVEAGFADLMLANADERLRLARATAAKDPDDKATRLMLLDAELNAGNIEVAERIASSLEVASPDDPEALQATAKVAIARGEYDRAVARLERVLGANERNQSARVLLIRAYEAKGDEQKAAANWRIFKALGGLPEILNG